MKVGEKILACGIMPDIDLFDLPEDYPVSFGAPERLGKVRGGKLILENTEMDYFRKHHESLKRLYDEVVGP